VFATTNVDDIVLLALFFADRRLRPRSVVIGQFAGIGVLTLASAVAALLALAVPDGWVALLGLAPLALGLRSLHGLWQPRPATDSDAELRDVAARGGRAMRLEWMAVALVTMANGGDNLAVYIPLFSRELSLVPVYAAVFAAMTALWCAAGYWLVNHPLLGGRIRKYGSAALPFVLVGLGLYILADARALLQ
jgi:cadmium resistance protein CadD (predicted permease)